MITSRSPYQPELDLPMSGRGEAPCRDGQEVEAIMARSESESLASTVHLIEAICDPDNIEAALNAVVRNKGAPGIDGLTVKQLPSILKARWPEIEEQQLQGRHQPQPVRRVQIPKPTGGCVTSAFQPRLIACFSKQSFSGYNRCGIRLSASTATVSGPAAPRIRRWRRRKPTSSKAVSSSSISTWPNFWTPFHIAPWFMSLDRKVWIVSLLL